jgi:hypothetical protein
MSHIDVSQFFIEYFDTRAAKAAKESEDRRELFGTQVEVVFARPTTLDGYAFQVMLAKAKTDAAAAAVVDAPLQQQQQMQAQIAYGAGEHTGARARARARVCVCVVVRDGML